MPNGQEKAESFADGSIEPSKERERERLWTEVHPFQRKLLPSVLLVSRRWKIHCGHWEAGEREAAGGGVKSSLIRGKASEDEVGEILLTAAALARIQATQRRCNNSELNKNFSLSSCAFPMICTLFNPRAPHPHVSECEGSRSLLKPAEETEKSELSREEAVSSVGRSLSQLDWRSCWTWHLDLELSSVDETTFGIRFESWGIGSTQRLERDREIERVGQWASIERS